MKKILLLTATLGLGTVGLLQCAAESTKAKGTKAELEMALPQERAGAGRAMRDLMFAFAEPTESDKFLVALDHIASIIRRGAGDRLTNQNLLTFLEEDMKSRQGVPGIGDENFIVALDRAARASLGDNYMNNYQDQEGMPVTDAEVREATDDFVAALVALLGRQDPLILGLFELVTDRAEYERGGKQYIENLSLNITTKKQ